MALSLTGDFGGLQTLERRLGRVDFRSITAATGAEVFEQYQDDFAAQRDPWGSSWDSGKGGRVPVLFRSGKLANPTKTIGATQIMLRPERYWVFHQVGANGAPQKAVVPFGAIEGTVWHGPMVAAVAGEVERQLGQKP